MSFQMRAASASSLADLSHSLKSSSVFALRSVPGATHIEGGTPSADASKASGPTHIGEDA
eukprot:6203220-Pleurochrysis_carterae.AAC.1